MTKHGMTISRRAALSATAALLAAARAATPRGAFAQGSTVPEVTKATLGYIALTDAAPLIIAKEKGIFAKYGMPDVSVEKQASWAATRDNLVLGGAANGIDGAHILTPMPYLISAGKVTLSDTPDRPGQFDAKVYLTPHYQLEGLSVALRLTSHVTAA